MVASGELQRLTMEHAGQTPRTAVRRLQELSEEGVLEVIYLKGHAHYKFKKQLDPLAWFDSLPDSHE